MSRIMTPDQMERHLDEIADQVRMLRDGWRWAHPDAYRRPKHGSAEMVSGGGRRDVADQIVATERYRSHLEVASRDVDNAVGALGHAVATLNDAMRLLEPPPGPEVADVRQLPRDPRLSVLRARVAKGRREQRAARTGDYAEVTGG